MAEKRQGPTPRVRLGEMSVKREVDSRLFARGYGNRITVLNELKILFTTYIDLSRPVLTDGNRPTILRRVGLETHSLQGCFLPNLS